MVIEIRNRSDAIRGIRKYELRREQVERWRRKMGILDVVAIIFIILKILGLIQWSWLWVLSPIWIALIIRCIGEIFKDM